MRLVSLDAARAWAGLAPAADPLLTLAVDGAEALVESAVGRPLDAWSGTERVDGSGTHTLYLSRAPVASIESIAYATAAEGVPLSQITSWAALAASHSPPAPEDVETDLAGGLTRLDGAAWPRGHRNVIVEYAAGYTPETLPADLRLLIVQLTAACFRGRGSEGLRAESLGDLSRTYAQPTEADLLGIPGAAATIARYRRAAV
jgi:hypothetical protein